MEEITMSNLRKKAWKISWTKGKAWTLFGESFVAGLLISVCSSVIFTIFMGIFTIIANLFNSTGEHIIIGIGSALAGILISIFSIAIFMGISASPLAIIKNPDGHSFFSTVCILLKKEHRKNIWKPAILVTLISIFTSVGLGLFLIPGIILLIRLSFAVDVYLEKDLGIWDSIEYSRAMTKGHFRKLVGFYLYFGLFNIIGFLCLFIGIVRTDGMLKFAKADLFLRLSQNYDKEHSEDSTINQHHTPIYESTIKYNQ